jgi:putative oxidoreductase
VSASNGLYLRFSHLASHGRDAALLAVRLTLAYGFYGPAMAKWNGIDSVAEWFATLGIPFPLLNAYLSANTELLGVILLGTGLLTRLISLPLIVVMVVAIVTVHLGNGFSCGDNGLEIPLYYLLFLGVLLTTGPGRWSLDRFYCEKEK